MSHLDQRWRTVAANANVTAILLAGMSTTLMFHLLRRAAHVGCGEHSNYTKTGDTCIFTGQTLQFQLHAELKGYMLVPHV